MSTSTPPPLAPEPPGAAPSSHGGRAYVITGGARGIGLSCAQHLVERGASVWLVDSGVDAAGGSPDESVVQEAALALGSAAFADARDVVAHSEAIVADACDHFGALDGVVNCAGFRRRGRVDGAARGRGEERASSLLTIRAEAGLRMALALAERTTRDRAASFVQLVHHAGFRGQQREVWEAMASGAAIGWIRTAALEMRRIDLRINGVAPTAYTRLTEELPLFQGRGRTAERLSAAHVAPLVGFLLSDAAREISGEIFAIAGDHLARVRAQEVAPPSKDGEERAFESPLSEHEVGDALSRLLRGLEG